MVNIVNKNIKIEIVYYELSNIKSAVTDIVRYSENRIREHLGIRNKIHVLTINPLSKAAIDNFFDDNLPARQFIDRRRKDVRVQEEEKHDYDKLYDVPKAEISPERALEIERESWDTTKRLTEAFADTETVDSESTTTISTYIPTVPEPEIVASVPISESNDLYSQLIAKLGDIAQFISLCKGSGIIEQRKFASSHNCTADEIADKINEASVELFGDIILEKDVNAYTIIEDYLFLFN
jgi:hypothetical protein